MYYTVYEFITLENLVYFHEKNVYCNISIMIFLIGTLMNSTFDSFLSLSFTGLRLGMVILLQSPMSAGSLSC
jgi:hypothetical protein